MVGLGGPAAAQGTQDSARAQALRDVHGPDGTGKDGPLWKAGVDLLTLYYRHQQAGDEATVTSEQSGLRVADGRIVVDAIAAAEPEQLRTDLQGLGMTETAVAGRVVSGRLPIEQIPAAARLETLRGLTPSRAQTRTERSISTPPKTPASPAAPAPQNDSTDAPAENGPILFLLGSALTVLFLESA